MTEKQEEKGLDKKSKCCGKKLTGFSECGDTIGHPENGVFWQCDDCQQEETCENCGHEKSLHHDDGISNDVCWHKNIKGYYNCFGCKKFKAQITHCKWYPNCNKKCVEAKNHSPAEFLDKADTPSVETDGNILACQKAEGTSKSKGCGRKFDFNKHGNKVCGKTADVVSIRPLKRKIHLCPSCKAKNHSPAEFLDKADTPSDETREALRDSEGAFNLSECEQRGYYTKGYYAKGDVKEFIKQGDVIFYADDYGNDKVSNKEWDYAVKKWERFKKLAGEELSK